MPKLFIRSLEVLKNYVNSTETENGMNFMQIKFLVCKARICGRSKVFGGISFFLLLNPGEITSSKIGPQNINWKEGLLMNQEKK
jgi:hypothetical protein